MIKVVKESIQRNTARKQKILSWEMKIAPRTMSCILKDDLGLAAYKICNFYFLTDNYKEQNRTDSFFKSAI